MEFLKKEESESQLDYILRLVKGKDNKTYDIDYVELFKLGFGVDLSSNESRKRYYALKMLLPHIDTEKLKSTTGQEMLDALTLQKFELQKEKVKVQTEKIELNKWIRETARIELLEEKIIKTIKILPCINIPEFKNTSNKDYCRVAIGGIADSHVGKEFCLKGLRGEILNEYNIKIFEQRMWLLLDKYEKIIKKENITHLHFYSMGDLIDGMLRQSILMTLSLGAVDSTIYVSEFLANWLNKLSENVVISYYSALGNHSENRPLGSSKGEFPNENMEKIINWFIKSRLENNSNIIFPENNGSFAFTTIEGFNVLAVHGQDEGSLEQSIKDYSLLYDERIDILLSAHYHSSSSKTIGANSDNNIEYIQFPSICGTDDYAKSKKKNSKAGSRLIVLDGNEKIHYEIILN